MVKLADWQRNQAGEAVKRLLQERGDEGALINEVKDLISRTLSLPQFPKADFGKILFVGKTKKVGNRYYALGKGPEKPKEAKTHSPMPNSSPNVRTLELQGDLNVTVKGSGYNIKAKALKVILFFSVLTFFAVYLGR